MYAYGHNDIRREAEGIWKHDDMLRTDFVELGWPSDDSSAKLAMKHYSP